MKSVFASIWKALHLPTNMQLFMMRLFQDQFLIGVTGVIFNKKNEILLFRHTYREYEWSLPGGYIKAKEHPKEALEREIQEESGLIVSADERLKIRTDRETARLDICYIGEFMGGEFVKSSEVSEIGFFAFENLPLLHNDQILLVKEAMNQRKRLGLYN